MGGIEAVSVSIPRESRKKRSCGIALVTLKSKSDALGVIAKMNGSLIAGKTLAVESTDGALSSDMVETDESHIKWKKDDELWDVALYDRTESVNQFNGRLQSCSTPLVGMSFDGSGPSAEFKAAATRERAEEREMSRDLFSNDN